MRIPIGQYPDLISIRAGYGLGVLFEYEPERLNKVVLRYLNHHEQHNKRLLNHCFLCVDGKVYQRFHHFLHGIDAKILIFLSS